MSTVKRILALLILLTATMAMSMEVTAPTGNHTYGTIPARASFEAGQTVKFELLKAGEMIDSTTVTAYSNTHQTTFTIYNKGTYTVRATAKYNGSSYTNTTTFTVTNSRIFLTVLSPENKTYSGAVALEVIPEQDNSVAHGATVIVAINGTAYALPESRNSYLGSAELGAGTYTATITATKDGVTETTTVGFTVSGEVTIGNETTYLPGPRTMVLKRSSPTSALYTPGTTDKIDVFLLDKDNQRVTGAHVTASVTRNETTDEVVLLEKTIAGKAYYEREYTFTDEGFYYITITATKAGYENASETLPAIHAGIDAPEVPADFQCENGICVKIKAPIETETYPDGAAVALGAQVIEEATTAPVNDATVTVEVATKRIMLDYAMNGDYTGNVTAPQGDYPLSFIIGFGGMDLIMNTTLHISPERLVITPIAPAPGSNETGDYTTIRMKVADSKGEQIVGANVRVVVTTPYTGTHTVQLKRDPDKGEYASTYAFADEGHYTLRIIASKIGFVSAEAVYNFAVARPQPGYSFEFTEETLIGVVLIIGIALVLTTLWRALL